MELRLGKEAKYINKLMMPFLNMVRPSIRTSQAARNATDSILKIFLFDKHGEANIFAWPMAPVSFGSPWSPGATLQEPLYCTIRWAKSFCKAINLEQNRIELHLIYLEILFVKDGTSLEKWKCPISGPPVLLYENSITLEVTRTSRRKIRSRVFYGLWMQYFV